MEEVAICTKLASSSVSEVVLSVNNCTTCREVVRLVEEELEVSFGRGWQLQEDWKGCSKLPSMTAGDNTGYISLRA